MEEADSHARSPVGKSDLSKTILPGQLGKRGGRTLKVCATAQKASWELNSITALKALSDGINLELFARAVDRQERGTGREGVRVLAFFEAGRGEGQYRGLLL